MANDSITNRISNEPNSTYRRNRFETLDRTQSSFFDQLLDASTFRSDFGIDLRNSLTPSRAITERDDRSNEESSKVEKPEDLDPASSDEELDDSISYSGVLPTAVSIPIDFVPKQPVDSTLTEIDEPATADELVDALSTSPIPKTDSTKANSKETKKEAQKEQPSVQNNEAHSGQNPVDATDQNQRSQLDLAPASNDQVAQQLETDALQESPETPSTVLTTSKRSDNNEIQQTRDPSDTVRNQLEDPSLPKDQVPYLASSAERIKATEATDQANEESKSQEKPLRSRRAERLANRAERNGRDSDRDGEDSNASSKTDSSRVGLNASTNAKERVSVADSASQTSVSVDSGLNAIAANSNAPNLALANAFPGAPAAPTPAIAGSINADRSPNAIGPVTANSSIVSAASKLDSPLSSNTTFSGNSNNSGAQASGAKGETVRGATGSSISPYQETKLVQRVLRGLEQLGDGGGQVRLRLHPPELGTLQLTLRMEGGQMQARMEVENSLAKDALLNNVQTLKDRLSEQGMQIESFDVQVSSDAGGSNGSNLDRQGGFGSDSRWNNAQSRFAQINNNRLSSDEPIAEKAPQQAWTRNHGSLDLTV